MFQAVDQFILARFQWLSDWVHEWTGLDCIIQARACSIWSAGAWLILSIEAVRASPMAISLAFNCLMMLWQGLWELPGDALAREAAQLSLRNPRNRDAFYMAFRNAYTAVAAFCVAIGSLGASRWIAVAGVCLWFSTYLRACDVQTPRVGRIREALRKLRLATRPASALG